MVLRHSLLGAYIAEHVYCCSSFPRILSSYQVVLWKQESFVVLCSLRIEFFRILLGSLNRSLMHHLDRPKHIRKKDAPPSRGMSINSFPSLRAPAMEGSGECPR